MCDVNNMKALITPFMDPGSTYIGYVAKRLTAPGDNYGSLVLAVEVKLRNKNNELETINLVAKKIPETEFLQKVFNVQVSFTTELQVYEQLIPTLINFQKEQGVNKAVDFFPEFYGGRLNNKPNSNTVDEDGVILLENLKLNGFKTFERTKGFNAQVAKFLLKELAVFHALPLAFKVKKPDIFQNEIMPLIPKFDIFADMAEEAKQVNFKRIFSMIEESNTCSMYLERVINAFNNYSSKDYTELFATLSHNDYWVNNTMVKVVNGKPVQSKFLDFQIIDYGSPGKDIIFFIYSSIQPHLIDKYFDEFITTYYTKFIETLKELDCDVTPFTFEMFQNELEASAKSSQLLHLLFMFTPICSERENLKELKDIETAEDMPQPTKLQKEKTWFTVEQFAKRNWI